MALDDDTRKIAEEVMGGNVLRQLGMVVPEFFGYPYVIVKLAVLPKGSHPSEQFIHRFEPRVMAATAEGYALGQAIRWEDEIAEMVGKGYALTISPEKIRAYRTDDYTLNQGPFDSLVISEANADLWERSINTIYSHRDGLNWGRSIGNGLNQHDFNEGICKCDIHFAFVPAGESARDVVGIRDFEDGIHFIGKGVPLH